MVKFDDVFVKEMRENGFETYSILEKIYTLHENYSVSGIIELRDHVESTNQKLNAYIARKLTAENKAKHQANKKEKDTHYTGSDGVRRQKKSSDSIDSGTTNHYNGQDDTTYDTSSHNTPYDSGGSFGGGGASGSWSDSSSYSSYSGD